MSFINFLLIIYNIFNKNIEVNNTFLKIKQKTLAGAGDFAVPVAYL